MRNIPKHAMYTRSLPIIWVSTGDPIRFLDELFRIANNPEQFGYRRGAPPRPVFVWSPAPTPDGDLGSSLQFLCGGWAKMIAPIRFEGARTRAGWNPALPDRQETEDILRAFWTMVSMVEKEKAGENHPAIWVMVWPHEAMQRPDVAWTLCGLVHETLRTSRHRLVLVAPAGTLPPPTVAEVVTVVEVGPPTVEELAAVVQGAQEHGGPLAALDPYAVARALAGLEYHQAENAILLAEAQAGPEGSPEDLLRMILRQKAEILRSVAGLEWLEPVPFTQVGGLDRLKALARALRRALAPDARDLGLEPPRGVLLAGPPGVGKTLTSRAIAWELGVPLVRLDLGAMYGPLLGQTEQALRRALAILPRLAPVVVQVDELEKAVGRGHGELDGGTSSRVLGMLLTRMQEMEGPVLFVATVNRIGLLPPELAERFELRYWLGLPGPESRRAIGLIHLGMRGYDPRALPEGLLAELVRATRGHSGRSIEQIIKRAHLEACADIPVGGRPDPARTLRLAISIASQTTPIAQAMADSLREIERWRDRFEPASSEDPEEALEAAPAGERRGRRLSD